MKIELVFDGGNHGSKTEEAYGSYRITVDDNVQVYRVIHGAGYTNNDAEYLTLIHALEYIVENYGISDIELTILGDSNLVRQQIGTYTIEHMPTIIRDVNILFPLWKGWKVNKLRLERYRDTARRILVKFTSFTYNYLPRKEVVKILGH